MPLCGVHCESPFQVRLETPEADRVGSTHVNTGSVAPSANRVPLRASLQSQENKRAGSVSAEPALVLGGLHGHVFPLGHGGGGLAWQPPDSFAAIVLALVSVTMRQAVEGGANDRLGIAGLQVRSS